MARVKKQSNSSTSRGSDPSLGGLCVEAELGCWDPGVAHVPRTSLCHQVPGPRPPATLEPGSPKLGGESHPHGRCPRWLLPEGRFTVVPRSRQGGAVCI
jgi:hypothetical protein